MRAFGKTAVIGSVLGFFILVGCDSSTNSSPSNPFSGTWKGAVSDSVLTLVISADSNFSAVYSDSLGPYQITGVYKYTGSTITLNYSSGYHVVGIPPPSPNPVTVTITGNKMRIPIPYNYTGDSTTLTKQ